MAATDRSLVPLSDLDDFKVAEGDPDVRGWEVRGAGSVKIGKVDDLLVDTEAEKVRYLSVELQEDLIRGRDDRHVLIPIGSAVLHEDDDHVLVSGLTTARVTDLPSYSAQPLNRDYEISLLKVYDPKYTAMTGDIYDHPLYESDPFYAPRRR